MTSDYAGPVQFAANERMTVDDEEARQIQAAIDHFSLENIKP